MLTHKFIPKVAFFEITSRCSLHCKHCISEGELLGGDLPIDEIFGTLADLKALGVETIKFTGGEPFEREDFLAILHYCDQMSMKYYVYTNGIFDHKYTEELSTIRNLISIRVSIDGYEGSHDSVRGDGVFARAINCVKLLYSKKIPTQVNYTISRLNYHDLKTLDTYFTREGIDVQINIGFIKMSGRARQNTYLCFSKVEANVLADEIQNIINNCQNIRSFQMLSDDFLRGNSDHFGCPAGQSSLIIAHNGDVYPCGMFRGIEEFNCGNVKVNVLRDIWDCRKMSQFRSITESARCKVCKIYNRQCTGACRGNAYMLYESIIGDDENCDFYWIKK